MYATTAPPPPPPSPPSTLQMLTRTAVHMPYSSGCTYTHTSPPSRHPATSLGTLTVPSTLREHPNHDVSPAVNLFTLCHGPNSITAACSKPVKPVALSSNHTLAIALQPRYSVEMLTKCLSVLARWAAKGTQRPADCGQYSTSDGHQQLRSMPHVPGPPGTGAQMHTLRSLHMPAKTSGRNAASGTHYFAAAIFS